MKRIFQKLLDWLSVEPVFEEKIFSASVVLVIKFVFAITFFMAINFLGVNLGQPESITWRLTASTFPVILLVTLVENFLFRSLPVYFINLFTKRTWNTSVVYVVVGIISSIILGLMSGTIYGFFLQGMGGFILFMLFVKCGGYNGKKLTPLVITTFVHSLFNCSFLGASVVFDFAKNFLA